MERCARCIIPKTAKGIVFNDSGECQLCSGFQKYIPLGGKALEKEIQPYIQDSPGFNCVVPVSGGRDSAFALYYAKRVLGLKPIAFHNNNDFETDIAKNNLQAMASALDVPLIRTFSPREHARKIVAEKFKMNLPYGPGLMVHHACEACKFGFETGAYNTARARGIKLVIWADSKYESTVPYHDLNPQQHAAPSSIKRLMAGQGWSLLKYRYYFSQLSKEYGPHHTRGIKEIHLYDYVQWDQNEIVETIGKHLGWSAPENSPTTWRVDCKLVPLVNYLTWKAYGVSKIELGFANMVRAGQMKREDAIQKGELIQQNMDLQQLRQLLLAMNIPEKTAGRILA